MKRPDILKQWDEIQHDPLSTPPDEFEGLSLDEAVERIREWFFENFEDPVHETPRDEGEYQYIWGGPYYTRDVIENIFADNASDELIQAAISIIEDGGSEWVPNSNRRQPPDGSPEDYEPPNPRLLHAEMQQRILRLEEIVSRLSGPLAGIGHNLPPEAIDVDVPEFSPGDRDQAGAALAVLKSQPVEAIDDGTAAVRAIEGLETTGRKFRAYLARQDDAFVSEATKAGGQDFGKWGPRALIAWFVNEVFELSSLVMQWLHAQGLQLPF